MVEPNISGSPEYAALLDPHKRVRDGGKRALACHAKGDSAGRDAALSDMDKASAEVLSILDRLARSILSSATAGKRSKAHA